MAGKTYPLLAALLAAVFALSACSRDVKPAPEFKRTDYERVVVSNGVEPGTLDPQMSGDMAADAIIRQLMDGLVSTDAEGKTIPALAEKWESEGERIWTFHLRDAKWSNGDPITAEDFVYSFRRLADPATGAPFGSYLVDAQVENAEDILNGKAKPETLGIKALDAKTLQFTLIAPVPYFPDMLIRQFTFPVHRATVEKYGNKWTQPGHYVSSGAYLLTDWKVNSHINMERNPNYYDKDKVAIPKAVFLSGSGEYNRYRANEIDVTYGIPSDQVKVADIEFPGQVKRTTSLCSWYLEPNHEAAPFNDPRVRKALNMLTRRDIVVKVGGRGDTPAFQLTPPQMQGVIPVYPEWKEWTPEKRIETARKLLNEAGYNDDHPLEFDILYSTSEASKKQITAVQSVWKAAIPFIRPTLSNEEWKTYLDTRAQGNFKVSFSGWCSDFNDPAGMLNILKSNNSNNAFRYKSAAFDTFMNNTLKDGVSKEARSQLYADAEKQLQEDAALIPLYHQVEVRMVKPDIIGYSDKDPLRNYTVKSWSFAPKK